MPNFNNPFETAMRIANVTVIGHREPVDAQKPTKFLATIFSSRDDGGDYGDRIYSQENIIEDTIEKLYEHLAKKKVEDIPSPEAVRYGESEEISWGETEIYEIIDHSYEDEYSLLSPDCCGVDTERLEATQTWKDHEIKLEAERIAKAKKEKAQQLSRAAAQEKSDREKYEELKARFEKPTEN